MELRQFYKYSILLVISGLLAWVCSLLFICFVANAIVYAKLAMMTSTLLGSAAILLVGFAHILLKTDL
ncbi:MAG: hypothetical protein TECD_00204 [Hyphomicrobiaceae bacterium hypho_1]